METEQEEKEHLCITIKVARDEDLGEQIGRDICFDLVDHEKVRSFHIRKQIPFNVFKEEVSKVLGIPVQFQRFWVWTKRQNHTYRPYRPLTKLEEKQPVGMLREFSQPVQNAELKLFLEVELGPHFCPIVPPDKTREDILLFFKHYDPEKEELRYVGRLFVKSTGKPIEILSRLNEMAGYDPDEEIDLYEEIKFEPTVLCFVVDKISTFRASELEDGDIICFQKSLGVESAEQFRSPDVPSFLEYVHNFQVVHFRSLEKPKEDDFCVEMSKLCTYDDVVENVAQQLGLDDPSKIRLTAHNCFSQQPKPQPIKYRGVNSLSDMLVCYNQASDILYYEVLDNPLPKLQCLKSLKVEFHHATKDEVIIHFIRLPKQSTVGDVLKDLKTKVELSHPNAELRLLEVFYHKIYRIFPPDEKIENIKDQYWTLRAEEIPEEEKNLGPNDCLIHVYHFTKDTAQNQMQIQNFGEPFFLVIHEGETLAEIKLRIQKKLLVADEEFAKWKFAFLSLGRPEYLQDCNILSSRFLKRNLFGAWEQYLGLEHSDNAHKRYYTANKEMLKKEHEEKLLKKKKAEAQLSTIIKVARDEDLGEQIGRDIYFDLVDYDKVRSFHFEKRTPFNVFKEEAAKVFGIPVQFQRFWLLAKRENHTCRPKLPLTHLDETRPSSDILYYEVLDIPLPELQIFKTPEVASHHAIKDEERLKKEHEGKELKKKKAEAQLCTIIKVARDEDLGEQIGRDIYFDLVDFDKVQNFRFEKQTPLNFFKEEVAKVFRIPVQFQRFWLLAKRENNTYRPKLPLTHLDETRPLGTLVEVSNKAQNVELKLFLEVERGLDLEPIAPPDKAKKDILIFFKHYNPEKKELRYVGRLFVKRTGKPTEILSRLNEMAGYSPDEEIDLFEEIQFEPTVMCESIDKKITFGASQLGDGDIICFQKSLPVESAEKFLYPDVPSFLEYLRNRQVVHFRSLENPKEDDFCLEMSKIDTYDNVVEKVAQLLGLNDPSKIRLTAHNCYSQQPKPQPIQHRGVGCLSDMLVHYNKSSSILYYEV